MISVPAGTNIWIAAGVTDLRRGFTGLSAMAQTALEQDPYSGHVFVFRGRRGDLIKLLWWDSCEVLRYVEWSVGTALQSGHRRFPLHIIMVRATVATPAQRYPFAIS